MTEDLLSQTDARREARRLNDEGKVPEGLIAIAGAVPLNSWGGQERGWTVYYVANSKSTRRSSL